MVKSDTFLLRFLNIYVMTPWKMSISLRYQLLHWLHLSALADGFFFWSVATFLSTVEAPWSLGKRSVVGIITPCTC